MIFGFLGPKIIEKNCIIIFQIIFKEFKISIFKEGTHLQKLKGLGIYAYRNAYMGIFCCFTYRSNEKTARK